MASNSITRKIPKLRKSAKGEECCLAIHPYCNGNTETTVLCHISSSVSSGAGIKPPDWFGVYGCSSCHDVIDGRIQVDASLGMAKHQIINDALFRTWQRMIEKGLIKI